MTNKLAKGRLRKYYTTCNKVTESKNQDKFVLKDLTYIDSET